MIIANSHAVKNEYARYVNPQKLHVVYQSVTLKEESEYATERTERKQVFTCVIVGSLQPLKGLQEAIAALAELARRGFDAELTIVGAGSSCFRQVLEHDIKRYGLEQRVVFHGYIENPAALIRAADVVHVFPLRIVRARCGRSYAGREADNRRCQRGNRGIDSRWKNRPAVQTG